MQLILAACKHSSNYMESIVPSEQGQLIQVGPNIVLAIAANKQDLRKHQAVSDAQLAEYAALIGALHFGTSAKTGEGLTDIFEAIANSVAEQHREKALSPGK